MSRSCRFGFHGHGVVDGDANNYDDGNNDEEDDGNDDEEDDGEEDDEVDDGDDLLFVIPCILSVFLYSIRVLVSHNNPSSNLCLGRIISFLSNLPFHNNKKVLSILNARCLLMFWK